jgi:hypothetical protein
MEIDPKLTARLDRIRSRVRRWHMAVAAIVVLVVVAALLGSGGSTGGVRPNASKAPAPLSYGAGHQADNRPPLGAPATAGTGGNAASLPATSQAAAGEAARGGSPASATSSSDTLVNGLVGESQNAKVVKTAAMGLQVPADRVARALDGVALIASAYPGGFVADQHSDGSTDHPSGSVTIRVPYANFDDALKAARQLGKVTTTQVSGKDVTADYVDLQARLQALQNSRQQFETLLLKAQSIPDILNVQDRINGLQVQIEQLQGQQKVLDDQTTFATLTVSVSDLAVIPPQPAKARSGFAKAWHDAGHGFTSALQRVVSGLGLLAFWLLVLAVGAAVAVTVRRARQRRQLAGSPSPSPSATEPSATA